MKPPYKITNIINQYVSEISKLLGRYEAIFKPIPSIQLRKRNKIRTIKSTLAIEGNTLTEEQITAILDGKKVLGKPKEILEVKNALLLYENIDKFKSESSKSLKNAHKILMNGLIDSAGNFRTGNVGILQGSKVKHVAPKAVMVSSLVENLFSWLKTTKDLTPLIRSCIAHYELEFIHPFDDGNGRIGRFWQTLILYEYEKIFQYLPIESLIEKNQNQYYKILEECDKDGESTKFIEFMLKLILSSLSDFILPLKTITVTEKDRLLNASKYFKNRMFTKKEYSEFIKDISSATASRDLKHGVLEKILSKSGQRNQTKYKFV